MSIEFIAGISICFGIIAFVAMLAYMLNDVYHIRTELNTKLSKEE